jgi:hypothetical protein
MKDWREDHGISVKIQYMQKFAWLPVRLTDGTKIFWKKYYKGYQCLYYREREQSFRNDGYVDSISEEEYLFKTLSGDIDSKGRQAVFQI